MAKVNISIDDRLLERVDSLADECYMSRSGLIASAITQYINSLDTVSAIKSIANCMQVIADKGTLDDETLKQLNDLETTCKVLFKK